MNVVNQTRLDRIEVWCFWSALEQTARTNIRLARLNRTVLRHRYRELEIDRSDAGLIQVTAQKFMIITP